MKEFDNPINKHFINACELLAQEFCKTLDVSCHKDVHPSVSTKRKTVNKAFRKLNLIKLG